MPLTENLTLAEAVEQIVYGANCTVCHEVRRIDLQAMLQKLGADFRLGDLRPRLRCAKCGSKKVIVTTLWKSSSTTERMTAHWR
jgi:hypothetical protein